MAGIVARLLELLRREVTLAEDGTQLNLLPPHAGHLDSAGRDIPTRPGQSRTDDGRCTSGLAMKPTRGSHGVVRTATPGENRGATERRAAVADSQDCPDVRSDLRAPHQMADLPI
jgi:hypothetical protein